jgi:rhodanese-related sulfurtransferase
MARTIRCIMLGVGLVLLLLAAAGCERGWAISLGVDRIASQDLTAALEQDKAGLILIDTRAPKDFAAGHIAGARNMSIDQVNGYLGRAKLSPYRTLIAICYHGTESLAAAAWARGHGFNKVYSLAGGMQAWRAAKLPEVRGPGPKPDPEWSKPPYVEGSYLDQLAAPAAGFVTKPLYMIVCLMVILFLRGGQGRALRLLRWSMILFLIGEAICAADYFAGGGSDVLELMHGLGMVGFGALLTWGIFVWLDERVLRFSDPGARCSFQRFCGRCWKRDEVSCGLQRLFLFAAPALALVALIPLSTPIVPITVTLPVFGDDVAYVKTLVEQLVEFRLFPALALLQLLYTTLRLLGGKESMERAQRPFFLALGLLSYSLLRYFLFSSFQQMLVWSDLWEELTELITILGVYVFLRVFSKQLKLGKHRAAPDPAGEGADGAG